MSTLQIHFRPAAGHHLFCFWLLLDLHRCALQNKVHVSSTDCGCRNFHSKQLCASNTHTHSLTRALLCEWPSKRLQTKVIDTEEHHWSRPFRYHLMSLSQLECFQSLHVIHFFLKRCSRTRSFAVCFYWCAHVLCCIERLLVTNTHAHAHQPFWLVDLFAVAMIVWFRLISQCVLMASMITVWLIVNSHSYQTLNVRFDVLTTLNPQSNCTIRSIVPCVYAFVSKIYQSIFAGRFFIFDQTIPPTLLSFDPNVICFGRFVAPACRFRSTLITHSLTCPNWFICSDLNHFVNWFSIDLHTTH